ncbi:MAG: hypothetical protein JST41_02965 [Bacteroidetes bacterium]|jgi:hypothetical protein|nr:hypothetical protein [Bacteroidota bacterium]MBX7129970.1 hypothetical protein [Flavobacteriales bacterium]MCC6654320.1 hypothetical protein [Flavobacteriales bacterium]HMU14904.1 hypothetical protein [Flavobacteriales bacterium]HMW95689.1 hypothetical protein [Flavobacteriales bacterium]
MRRTILLLMLVAATALARAQDVTVHGQVQGGDGERTFYDLMIVNRRLRTGNFGNVDGSFTVSALRNDTLLIGAGGYVTRTVPLSEYTDAELAALKVTLRPWEIQLKPVAVLPERTLKEIQADIDKLGYDEKDYRTAGVNALQSPITFLYQEFSRRERSKRMVAELRNEDAKRALLRELLYKYVEYDIINLSNDSFDDFIDFCAVPDEVIKGLSQYDFLMYVKKKYELYTSLGPTRRH